MQIKLNKSKSVHIDFTNKIRQRPVFISGTKVPYANTVKYLGMTPMPSYSGKSILRKNTSSTSGSRKCIGCLDTILSCQSTINSYYTSKLYVQFGVVVSSSGADVPSGLCLTTSQETKLGRTPFSMHVHKLMHAAPLFCAVIIQGQLQLT
jgi:hypothetical protein